MSENEQNIEEANEQQPTVYDIEKEGIPDWALPDTSSERVVLVDGTSIKARAATDFDGDNLWIWVKADAGLDFTAIATLFMDATKTSTIIFHNMIGAETSYVGYSRMAGINFGKNGEYTVQMKKP